MAERYDEQYRGDRGPQRDGRGLIDRAGDEVRSWFGDDDAERRRQMDDREADRYRMRDRMSNTGSYGRGEDRGYGPDYRDHRSDFRSDPRPESYRPMSGYRGYGQGWQGYGSSSGQGPSYGSGYGQEYGRDDARGFGLDRSRESFVGRGPKNYQRSDERINEDVCDRLCESSEIDASEIEVKVAGGEVTLSGSVFDRHDKRRAEDLVEQVSGVREVHNNLRVGRGQEFQAGAGTSGSIGRAGAGSSGVGATTSSHPGITGGGPSGATDVSTDSASHPGSPLGLSDPPEKTSTAGGRR